MSFRIEKDLVATWQHQISRRSKRECMKVLERASLGRIDVYGHSFDLDLGSVKVCDFYSEMIHRDRWYSDLHLQVLGDRIPLPSATDVLRMENELRGSNPPFDGLADITAWMGMGNPQLAQHPPSISIRVGPPVDLIFPECSVRDDQLRLTLYAHPRFDVDRIGLAVRAVPGSGLESRKQVKAEIEWKRARNGKREGIAVVHLDQADSVLAILMIGETCVRRQWFLDPTKARNNRLVAVQHFDKDLRMVRQAVLEPIDSARFEKGVAALLFLLGFTPALQLETNSPDLVVTTPGGKLVVIECTTRIADFNSKLGKLVDRRGSLSKVLQASNHFSRVDAILVCALPRNQIAMQGSDLETHQIVLITKEGLTAAFDRLRFPNDPDEMLEGAVAKLSASSDERIV